MIRLDKITKNYQPSKDVVVQALKNISITINSGEFVALLGNSGSGKSTLLYIIGLLEKATSGSIFIKDKNISELNDAQISRIRNKTIGFVFQQFNLITKLTVLENVLLPAAYSAYGIQKENKDYARYLLETFGILEKGNSFPNQLSGGQQQRVAIARALINKPEVIIADEPTGNLDSKTGIQIMDLIKEIHLKEKKTIVLVTHDEHIARYAKRIVRIVDGGITT
ncbi:MAG: ABC transporter ATP-binding protein [Patescibacteria group bacterium]|jgi:putative ABC transport system ATP-binding protein